MAICFVYNLKFYSSNYVYSLPEKVNNKEVSTDQSVLSLLHRSNLNCNELISFSYLCQSVLQSLAESRKFIRSWSKTEVVWNIQPFAEDPACIPCWCNSPKSVRQSNSTTGFIARSVLASIVQRNYLCSKLNWRSANH